MIKMNEKGFAVSTMLYGILIMATLIMTLLISTMALTRKSSVDFISALETELNSCVNPDLPTCKIK